MTRKDAQVPGQRRGVWKRRFVWLGASLVILSAAILVRRAWGPEAASAQAPRRGAVQQASATAAASARSPSSGAVPGEVQAGTPRKLTVMATVNGTQITRQQLATACMQRFGKEVLESVMNKHLIAQHCRTHNITITDEEVKQEIHQMAAKFNLGVDQWLGLLIKERGITPEQYARDIIWPTIALRKLAASRIEPTAADVHEAYERQFGESVQTRLIAVKDPQLAAQLRAQLVTRPDDFARLAREHSVDVSSASNGGLLQPIHRHLGDGKVEKAIENAVFALKEGGLSPVVKIGEQYAIFKCEQRIPARKVPLADVQKRLGDSIRESKLRDVAKDIFAEAQAEAAVENIYNDPQKRQQMPGVAAVINGRRITLLELAEECLARHGKDVLEGEINRLLLEQALKKHKLQVTQADIQAEIAHAAVLSGVVDAEGKADMKQWIELVTKESEVTYEQYVTDAVWPSAALKKLVSGSVAATPEDLQKGFDANYGPRVNCRAIVMSNLRRAQEVWGKARQNPTAEFFGELAKQYSIEVGSRDLAGEVPPIRKHGGQPVLEKEAFALQPGEMSGVIQVGDKFVILYCDGYTKPIEVKMDEVRELIERDVYEKKLRIAMAETFDRLHEDAQIDNILAGTSHSPPKAPSSTRGAAPTNTARRPAPETVPVPR